MAGIGQEVKRETEKKSRQTKSIFFFSVFTFDFFRKFFSSAFMDGKRVFRKILLLGSKNFFFTHTCANVAICLKLLN